MTLPDTRISIIIVNFNAGEMLARCFEHIVTQTYPHWEVIIVDNASEDSSLATIQGHERVTIMRNTDNVGFAAAQNQGLRFAESAYLMPLNFDIRMTPTFVTELVAALEADPQVGAVCGKLLRMTPEWEPTQEIDSTGLIIGPSLVPTSRGHGEVDCGQFDHQPRIFGAQGAAPLYRREMLEDIAFEGQYFDECFFMWYEDVDLDWRAYLRGWECRFAPKAVAYHMGHPSADRQTDFHVRTTVRNRWLMLLTNLAGLELRRCWTSWLMYEVGQLRYVTRIGRLPAYLAALRELFARRDYIVRKRRWVRSRAMRALWSVSP